MVRSKAPKKKQQSHGVDFKKIKRKVGRKLPPPKNSTNIEIKSKAIILREQSVASDKVGLAVTKKGLTLKELLQQTSNHNVKVRKDAFLGIRKLLCKYPTELKLHKLAIIEKLRERIIDDDKVVRETLYELFKSVILPGCKEDNQGALISLVMAYIFNAMTHLSIDVRLMAFKFFDLVVRHYPPAFSLYAVKVLENYIDILQKNQFHLEDKSKLKGTLSGVVRCLSLLPSNEKEVHSSGQNAPDKQVLHAFDSDVPEDRTTGHVLIVGKLKDLVPVLVNCFDGLISMVNEDSQTFDCMLSILQGIDLVVQYFVYEICKYPKDLNTPTRPIVSSDIPQRDHKNRPLLLDRLFAVFPMRPIHHLSEKDDQRYFVLNVVICQIFFTFSKFICPPPVQLDGFLNFLIDVLNFLTDVLYMVKIKDSELSESDKALKEKQNKFYEKHLLTLVPFIPNLLSTADRSWKSPLLQAFTKVFRDCSPDSRMKMACLKAVEKMLVSKQDIRFQDAVEDEEALDCQRTWISEIPRLLNSLGNKNPKFSHEVLLLQLRLGQIGLLNSDLEEEYDKIQNDLQNYYCICSETGDLCYGPFMELPRDSQEISICCLYYFTTLKQHLLASLAFCCLSHSLEPFILFRIIEVLQSSYKAGHIQLADHISFFITLLSQYEVVPEETYSTMEKESKASNQDMFRSVTGVICSSLSQMGDQSLLLPLFEEVVLDLTSCKLPVDNTCALMRMLITVDSRPTRLSEKSIIKLSDILLGYLIDIALLFPEDDKECTASNNISTLRYYLLPCFVLLDRSTALLKGLLDKMGSLAVESCELPLVRDTLVTQDLPRKINAIVSVISIICKDVKLRQIISSCKPEIDNILQSLLALQSSVVSTMNFEQQHKVQCAVDRLINDFLGTSS